MPCNECQKKASLPPAVLEIVNQCDPVLFHKVIFPASLGDDTEYPADTLNYKNVLLQYAANNHVYLYSSDGAATQLPTGETDLTAIKDTLAQHGIDIDNLKTDVATLQTDLATETTNRESGDTALQNSIAEETQNRQDADNELRDSIDANTSSLNTLNTTVANQGEQITVLGNNLQDATTELQTDIANEALARQEEDDKLQTNIDANTSTIDAINTNLNQPVEYATQFSSNDSTITVTHSRVNLNTNVKSSASEALPVASSTESGIMNVATFNAVQSNSDLTNALLNGAVAITGLPEEPTQTDLSDAWKAATGLTTLINRASIFDSTHQKIWTYYTNDTTWHATGTTEGVTVSQATNNSLGVVKGSEMPGQNYVEADGSLSLNGWDATQSAISTLQSTVSTQGETLASTVSQLDTTIEDVNDALGDIAAIQADYVSKTKVLDNYSVSPETSEIYSAEYMNTALGGKINVSDIMTPAEFKAAWEAA